MNKIIGVIVALLVVGGGLYFVMNGQEPQADVYSEKVTTEVVLDAEPVVPQDVQTVEEVGVVTAGVVETEVIAAVQPAPVVQNIVVQKPGMFLAYSASEVSNPSNDDVVLAFFADWCPSCRAAKSDIQANLGSIPANLTILDVDYDEYTDLKKKYGINQQHTFVQVDKTGAVIKTWKGGNTLDSIVAQVN